MNCTTCGSMDHDTDDCSRPAPTDREATPLLPCPFCGDRHPFSGYVAKSSLGGYVKCDMCERNGHAVIKRELTEAAAIAAWNRRAAPEDRTSEAAGLTADDAMFLQRLAAGFEFRARTTRHLEESQDAERVAKRLHELAARSASSPPTEARP